VHLTPRPGGNSKIFVRVFNAPDLSAASFYGDSALFTVRSWRNDDFRANVQSTGLPLDAADSDGDGLNNSWEKSYGTDPASSDSDCDGASDSEEVFAGTDPADPDSRLELHGFSVVNGGYALLRWWGAATKHYEVQTAAGGPGAPAEAYRTVAIVRGRDAEVEAYLPGILEEELCAVRIRIRNLIPQ